MEVDVQVQVEAYPTNGTSPDSPRAWMIFDLTMMSMYFLVAIYVFIMSIVTIRNRKETRGWKARAIFIFFIFAQTIGNIWYNYY